MDKDLRDLVKVKIANSLKIHRQVVQLCLAFVESEDNGILLQIGSLLGDLSNNLRSALNYTMRHFVETKLKAQLSSSQFRNLQRRSDFPWATSKDGFDKKLVVTLTEESFGDIYRFLEEHQPYHEGNEWLGDLMRISNRDKHEIINRVLAPGLTDVIGIHQDGTMHPKPLFVGDDKLLIAGGPTPTIHQLPCFYPPYRAFALKGGKWSVFMIVVDPSSPYKPDLIRFTEETPSKVAKLITAFTALF